MSLKLAAIAMTAVFIVGGCGGDPPAPIAVNESPSPDQSDSGTPSPTPPETPDGTDSQGSVSVEAWFNDGERLVVAYRAVPATRTVGRAAMEQLLSGPSNAEASEGMGTQVPAGTRLRGLAVSNGVATVDLSREFESGGGSLSMSMRVAQVVYTLTQFPTVDAVAIEIDGERAESLGGEGIDTSTPLVRDDFSDHAPPIVVTSPRPGQEVAPGAVVRGDADVFEATVSLRVLDADGKDLFEGFTTATCGSGCRGTYQKKLRFSVDTEQEGVIEVYSASPEDGSPQHMVRVPVRLVP